jgi:hypothetical protein
MKVVKNCLKDFTRGGKITIIPLEVNTAYLFVPLNRYNVTYVLLKRHFSNTFAILGIDYKVLPERMLLIIRSGGN